MYNFFLYKVRIQDKTFELDSYQLNDIVNIRFSILENKKETQTKRRCVSILLCLNHNEYYSCVEQRNNPW